MNKNEDDKVNLDSFASLTGFPVELIRKELFENANVDSEINLEDLRAAMLSYLDSTMLESEVVTEKN